MPSILYAVLASLLLFACSSPSAPPALDPVFVVMCADPDPEEPHFPCCTGFALHDQVVTANHCVPGDTAELVSNKQWLTTSNESELGTVTARDVGRDIAWLSAQLDGFGLTQGALAGPNESVSALTRSGVKAGELKRQAGDFWLTTISSHMGDSGSAIVDASGAAVGVLSRCTTPDGKVCDPNSAIFAEFP